MRNWMETRVPRRLLSLALSAAMVLSLLPAPSFAVESGGLCEHHSSHTDCGYKAAVEGHACGHVCGEACYTVTTDCKHNHGESCYSDGVLPAEGEEKTADACTHDCTEESGCVTKTHICVHTTHDDSCGYVEAVAGQPCGYVCEACAGESDAPAESKPEEKTDKVITDWAWVDPDEWLDETGSLAMPGVTEDCPAYFDDVVEYLPTQITADGGEVLTLGDWVCDTYPMETGTAWGDYVFETTLPAGYLLSDGSNVLRVNVTIAPVDLTKGPEAAVYATDITYLDSTGNTQTCDSATVVTDSDTAWSNGWYVVQGNVTIGTEEAPQRVTVSGNVNLILADGSSLTVNRGIGVNEGNSLTIYAQSTGSNMGKLTAQNVNNLYAGIGGDKNFSGGTIIINGGTVTAKGGEWAAGIGGGDQGSGGTITINGGNVYADGAYGSVGIGGGRNGTGGNITISGGNVTATGGTTAAGIGGSDSGSGGEIAISGNAIVNATGGMLAAGIGGSPQSAGGIITISGGSVTATGGIGGGAGIGGGDQGSGGNITISGGSVTATGGDYGAGIGGGGSNWAANGGSGGNITISGGTVTANGGQNGGAGIGGGRGESTSGGSGTFSTGTNGNAVIYASSISDTSSQGSWSGIIFEGDNGTVYGDQILTEDLTIEAEKALTVPAGAKLTIPEGVTLTSNGTITNNGTIIKNGTINGTITGNQPTVSVKYLDANGTETTCASATVVTDSDTAWSAGWYVVQGDVTIGSRITVSGEVHLILEDGCDLTVSGGIGVNEGNSLTIYAQSTDESTMGILTANGAYAGAGIGGDTNGNGNGHNGGTITINGGNITATSSYGAGIGGGAGSNGNGGSGGSITINGGTVTATSSDGAGIGGGMSNYTGGSGGNITINGGTVTATSSIRSAGIGGGCGLSGGAGGTIIISGGTVTANGGQDGGAGIGDSKNGSGGTFSTGENGTAVIFASSISDTSKKDSWGGSVYFPLNLTDCTATGGVSTYPGKLYGLCGGSITLTAQPPEGKAFTGWQSDDVNVIDGSFTMPDHAVTVTAEFGNIVASVTHGGTVTNYVSFPDAFDAANRAADSTLKLHADVTAFSNLSVGYSFTLDLNGKTLTSTNIVSEAISVNGSLTITDSSETKNGVIQTNTNQYVICNYRNLTIEGGAIRARHCINNNGTLVMNDGTLETNSSDPGFCIFNEVGSAVTITGGTLKKQAGSNIFKWVEGITLQGGSFPDGISFSADGSVRSLLGEGYAFYNYTEFTQNGKQTLVSVDNLRTGIDDGVVVLPHPEHTFSCEKKDDHQHTATCGCGYSELLDHDFTDNNGFCQQCDAYEPAEKVFTGSYDKKYNIYNAGQLFWFANYVNNSTVLYARHAEGGLQNDITIPEKADGSNRAWTPIGSVDAPYRGAFNGNSHSISGLYFEGEVQYASLFGMVEGPESRIENLTIESVEYNVHDIYSMIAGICGVLKGGEIRNCTNLADIYSHERQGTAGICYENYGTISGCTNTGTIYAGSFATAGGICAINNGSISECTNTGTIYGAIVGGICAENGYHEGGNNASIENCANRGQINGVAVVGGICANNFGTVSDCYHSGGITGEARERGPIVGEILLLDGGSCSNCFYLAEWETDELDGTTFKTQAQFASGEVAYLLNIDPSADDVVWGQRIGEERYPVLGGDRVYRHGPCPVYSNDPQGSGNQHTPGENGTCEHCGVALEATVTITDDGSGQTYGYVNLRDAFAAANGNTATITLLRDVNIGSNTLTISGGEVTFRSDEKHGEEGPTLYSITANGVHSSNAVTGIAVTGGTFNFDSGILQVSSGLDGIRVTGGTLNFRDGTIKHYAGMSIRIMEGEANISGGTIQGVCADHGTLNISAGFIEDLIVAHAQTALSGGSFRSIYHSTGTVSKLLADGYAYYLEGRWVDATNGSNGGTLASSPEAIQVRSVPVKIETQPADTTLTYGEDKFLSIEAMGSGVEYQWYQVTTNEAGDALLGEGRTFDLSGLNAGSHSIYCKLTCDGYVLNSNTVTVTVNKAIVQTPTIASEPYNGSVQTADISDTALYTVTTNEGGTDVGSYDVVLTLKDSSNYQWNNTEEPENTISFQITTASNPWTTEPAISGWTYGDAPSTPVGAAQFGSVTVTYMSKDGTISYDTTPPTNAGDYTALFSVAPGMAPQGENYYGKTQTVDFTISPKPITVTITPNGGTFGGTITPATAVANDLVGDDQVDVTLTYTGAANDSTGYNSTTAPSKAGSYTVTASISDSNYRLTGETTAQFVVAKATVTTPTVGSKVYTGETLTADVPTSGLYSVETNNGGTDVGSYDVVLTLTDSDNYQWDDNGGKTTFQITKATSNNWTTEPAISDWTYGDTPSTPTGAARFGTVIVEYTSDGTTYSKTAPTKAGSYTARFTVEETDNFVGLSAEKDFTISKAPLTITARDKTIIYGDAPGNNGVEYSGFVNSEDESVLGGTLAYDYSYSQYGNAGSYTITPKGLTSGNYNISYLDGSLTVQQKEVGISWSNTQLTYSGSAQMPTAAPTGFVNNDAITLTVSGAQTNAGTGYTATVAAITGAKAGNYVLPESVTTAFSIAQKEVTITGTAVEATKVYDGGVTAQITSDGTLSDNYDGSNLTIVRGSAAYDTKNVGEGKSVTFSGFSLGGSAAGNYTLTAQPASVTAAITAKPVTLTVTVNDKAFDGTTTAEIDTVTPNSIVSGDSVQVENGTPSFEKSSPGDAIPVSFTEFTLTGTDIGNYQLTQPTGVTGRILASGRYLNLAGNTDFSGQTEVWVDGVAYPIQTEGGAYVALPESGGLLTTFTYESGSSALSHESYPTGMAVYRIDRQDSGAAVEKIDAFNDLLQYSGCSIRITGKRGIRMITSLTKENKKALTKAGLAGYTLEEYGTVVQWADVLGDDSLTLANGKHNFAYKKGTADPVFATSGNLTQYTNVLVWNSLTDTQLGQDIVMRPYIVLRNGDETVTLYGGCVTRSIGYIAYQNRTAFKPGTSAYKYVWDIIHTVYGTQYDNEYQG